MQHSPKSSSGASKRTSRRDATAHRHYWTHTKRDRFYSLLYNTDRRYHFVQLFRSLLLLFSLFYYIIDNLINSFRKSASLFFWNLFLYLYLSLSISRSFLSSLPKVIIYKYTKHLHNMWIEKNVCFFQLKKQEKRLITASFFLYYICKLQVFHSLESTHIIHFLLTNYL